MMLLKLVFLVTLMSISTSLALECLNCDTIKADWSPRGCFEENVGIVDTIRDLGDLSGMFNRCVDIKMANGSVLQLGVYPGYPTCGKKFLETWKKSLERRFETEISVTCCDFDLCNGGKRFEAFSGILTLLLLCLHIYS